jgi:hypothetical protein
MSWVNTGSGKMPKMYNPFLFILTPGTPETGTVQSSDFGTCVPAGLGGSTIVLDPTKCDLKTGGCCNNAATECARSCTRNYDSYARTCMRAYCGATDTSVIDNCLSTVLGKTVVSGALSSTSVAVSTVSIDSYKNSYADCEKLMTCGEATGDYDNCMKDKMIPVTSCYSGCTDTYGKCVSYVGGQNLGDVSKTATCNSIYAIDTKATCIICDQYLYDSWCQNSSAVFQSIATYTPTVLDIFKWVCDKAVENPRRYHVCGTNVLTEEFNVFSCQLKMCQNPIKDAIVKCPLYGNLNRKTNYVTAVALYPYEVSAQTKVQSFCIEGRCP